MMDFITLTLFLALDFLDFDDSLVDNFDDSTLDELDDTSDEDDLDEPEMEEHDDSGDENGVPNDIDDIDDSDVEEHDDTSEEKDLLPEFVLVRAHDDRHAVGLVTLALVAAGRALPLIDNGALLGGKLFTHLVLNSLALPLIEHLALGVSSVGAFLLLDRGALLLVPGAVLLVKLGGALLLVDDLLDSPGQDGALHLRDVVTFLLDISTHGIGDILALSHLGDGREGLGHWPGLDINTGFF